MLVYRYNYRQRLKYKIWDISSAGLSRSKFFTYNYIVTLISMCGVNILHLSALSWLCPKLLLVKPWYVCSLIQDFRRLGITMKRLPSDFRIQGQLRQGNQTNTLILLGTIHYNYFIYSVKSQKIIIDHNTFTHRQRDKMKSRSVFYRLYHGDFSELWQLFALLIGS